MQRYFVAAKPGTAPITLPPEIAHHLTTVLRAQRGTQVELVLADHQAYLAEREKLGHVDEIAGISAGGMPTRVKCLHALVGHSLAAGAGVNPIGDIAIETMRERGLWDKQVCNCKDGK